jgi:hypothetical protein
VGGLSPAPSPAPSCPRETAWLQHLHVLFFTRLEIASRKVHLGGITASPTGEWVAQQARNLAWKVQDGTVKPTSIPIRTVNVIAVIPTGRRTEVPMPDAQ